MEPIFLDGPVLNIADLVAVARHRAPAAFSEAGVRRVGRTGELIARWVAEKRVI
jgi:histidine ammonia-lyase